MIGYAISDMEEQHNDIEHSLSVLGSKVIEIQKEVKVWDNKIIKQAVKNYDFISVHAPTFNTDISSVNQKTRERSIAKTLTSMNLANQIKADVLVMHPVHYEEFISQKDRIWKRDLFMDSFENLIVPYYQENQHNYKIGIENIEYSKYPSTLEELAELQAATSAIHPTGMVIDIAHIWNSRRILAENEYLKDTVYGYPRNPEILVEYIAEFVKHEKSKILMYHVANFGVDPIRTHDALTDINSDLKRLLPLLKDKPIILEIYGQSYETLIQSRKIAEEITKNGEY